MSIPESADILPHLLNGEIIVQGEFIWGSNITFQVEVKLGGHSVLAVYKPIRGERPLWDFPVASLAKREVAAYWVSKYVGWHFVPPTVYRKKAPFGAGSVQLYIEHDAKKHYFNLSPSEIEQLKPAALFDILINNADRKGSHIIQDASGKFWLIDHGLCFHVEDKLRTVIWDFAGAPIPRDLLADLQAFNRNVIDKKEWQQTLRAYLTEAELRAILLRGEKLVAEGVFPHPGPYRRHIPWPQL